MDRIPGAARDGGGEHRLEHAAGEGESGQLERVVGTRGLTGEDEQGHGGRQAHGAGDRSGGDQQPGGDAPQESGEERRDLEVGDDHAGERGDGAGEGGDQHREGAVPARVADVREPGDERAAAGDGAGGDVVGEHPGDERHGDAEGVAGRETEAETGDLIGAQRGPRRTGRAFAARAGACQRASSSTAKGRRRSITSRPGRAS